MEQQYNRIFLSPPHIGDHEKEYVNEAFVSNWVAPIGPNVDAFESELASYVNVKGALALSSGTAAIHLALRLIGVKNRDIVFCSSLTFIASANPILYLGAKPVFIDSEPSTWNMSPTALLEAMEDHKKKGTLPKAVIVVNLYGQSADMDPIMNICKSYNVPVIEDAAESLGARYKDKASGTIGDYGIYSFNGNKIITTSGGGMLVTNRIEDINKARFWATQARDKAVHYQHTEMGYNYRMSNILAGIGRGQLKVLEDRVRSRRRIFEVYKEQLGNIPGISFMPESEHGIHTRWLTTLIIEPKKNESISYQVIDFLENNNIESRPVWKPLHLQPLFKNELSYNHFENKNTSEYLFNYGICLPSGSSLTESEQLRVIECFKSAIKKHG